MEKTEHAIPLRLLHVGAYNPRRVVLRNTAFNELKESIKVRGVFTPILVRKVESGITPYEIIAGQRRFVAAMEAKGLDYAIPVLLVNLTDQEAKECSAAENIDREPMSEAENAEAAANLLAECNGDKVETAKRMGWSVATLNNRLKLMACSTLVRTRLAEGKIYLGVAELLSGMTSEKQDEMIRRFDEQGVPSADECFAIVMAATKSLPTAIFDTSECESCPQNSAAQRSMFGNIDDGYCMNASCYDDKTQRKMDQIAMDLRQQYQRVEFIAPGENFRVAIVSTAALGEKQATACRSCADFGAAVSAMPNNLGKVRESVCFGLECNAQMQKRHSAGASFTSVSKSDEPHVTSSEEQVHRPTSIALTNAILEYRDSLYRTILVKAYADNPQLRNTFLLAVLMSGKASYIGQSDVAAAIRQIGLTLGEMESDIGSAMEQAKTFDSLAVDMVISKIAQIAVNGFSRHELKTMVKQLCPDFNAYFQLNGSSGQEFLSALTKMQILEYARSLGLEAHLEAKELVGLASAKKDHIIQVLTRVQGFSYDSIFPEILLPDFGREQ